MVVAVAEEPGSDKVSLHVCDAKKAVPAVTRAQRQKQQPQRAKDSKPAPDAAPPAATALPSVPLHMTSTRLVVDGALQTVLLVTSMDLCVRGYVQERPSGALREVAVATHVPELDGLSSGYNVTPRRGGRYRSAGGRSRPRTHPCACRGRRHSVAALRIVHDTVAHTRIVVAGLQDGTLLLSTCLGLAEGAAPSTDAAPSVQTCTFDSPVVAVVPFRPSEAPGTVHARLGALDRGIVDMLARGVPLQGATHAAVGRQLLEWAQRQGVVHAPATPAAPNPMPWHVLVCTALEGAHVYQCVAPRRCTTVRMTRPHRAWHACVGAGGRGRASVRDHDGCVRHIATSWAPACTHRRRCTSRIAMISQCAGSWRTWWRLTGNRNCWWELTAVRCWRTALWRPRLRRRRCMPWRGDTSLRTLFAVCTPST